MELVILLTFHRSPPGLGMVVILSGEAVPYYGPLTIKEEEEGMKEVILIEINAHFDRIIGNSWLM